MGKMSKMCDSAYSKNANATTSGQGDLSSGLMKSNEQPEFGVPNKYADSIFGNYSTPDLSGRKSWNRPYVQSLDGASLFSRPQYASVGKAGKFSPSGVGYPKKESDKNGVVEQVVQQVQEKQPIIDSPLRNIKPISANALYASRGATGDLEGMKYWQSRYAAGEDPAQIQKDFNASFDYVKSQQKAV